MMNSTTEQTRTGGTSDYGETERATGHAPRRRGWRVYAALVLVILGGLALAGATLRDVAARPETPRVGSVSASLSGEPPLMPADPRDGVLTLAIPPGAAADQRAGGPGYRMPSVINLRVGDSIVLRNDDNAPHMILYAFLAPGETQTRTFTTSGSEVYSSGCGVHAAAFPNFTTIFVAEAA